MDFHWDDLTHLSSLDELLWPGRQDALTDRALASAHPWNWVRGQPHLKYTVWGWARNSPDKNIRGLLYRREKWWQAKTTDVHGRCQKEVKVIKLWTKSGRSCSGSCSQPGTSQIYRRTQGLRDRYPDHLWYKCLFNNWFRASWARFLLLLKEIHPLPARSQTPHSEENSSPSALSFSFL